MPSQNGKSAVKLSLPLVRDIPGDHQTEKLTYRKEYQQDIFAELRAEDELVLLARGLGLLRVVINLLHSYDAAGNNLIVVVGADDRENGWIGEGPPRTACCRVTRR
jgi:DNA excision repair protein ERCC-4